MLLIPVAAGLTTRPPESAAQAITSAEPAVAGSPAPIAGTLAAAATVVPSPSPDPVETLAPARSPDPAATPAPSPALATTPATTRAPTGTPEPSPAPTSTLTPTPAPPGTPTPAPAGSSGSDGIAPASASVVGWTGTRAPALDELEGYRWPLAHPRLTLPFGPTPWGSRFVNGEPFHDGVDLATFCNDKILAAHSGTVLAAGRHFDDLMGWVGDLRPYYRRLDRNNIWSQLPIVVVVDDGNGYRSMYAHMWKITVKKGDKVKAGQVIGFEGMTGRASGCHLHYGLFSPLETATFRIRPDVVKRMKLPKEQIARVDPLLVLPPRAGINAPARPKVSDAPKASAAATTAP